MWTSLGGLLCGQGEERSGKGGETVEMGGQVDSCLEVLRALLGLCRAEAGGHVGTEKWKPCWLPRAAVTTC